MMIEWQLLQVHVYSSHHLQQFIHWAHQPVLKACYEGKGFLQTRPSQLYRVVGQVSAWGWRETRGANCEVSVKCRGVATLAR